MSLLVASYIHYDKQWTCYETQDSNMTDTVISTIAANFEIHEVIPTAKSRHQLFALTSFTIRLNFTPSVPK